MVKPPQRPPAPAPGSPTPPRVDAPYHPGDPIPVPHAVETDTDTTWQLFQELSESHDRPYADTAPMTIPAAARPVPTAPPSRQAGPSLHDKLLAELTKSNRVCPAPAKWNEFYDELRLNGPEGQLKLLAPPMTGPVWSATSSLAKRMSLKDQVGWAASHGLADLAYRFLTRLEEEEWYHMGDTLR